MHYSNVCMLLIIDQCIVQKSTSATPGANFFLASIPLTTTTCIPSDSWECLNTGNEWRNIILQALGKANPYCSFAFKNKWQKKEGSRKSSSVCFRCTGSCTFADCPVRFKVEVMSFCQKWSSSAVKSISAFFIKICKAW